MAKIKQLAGDVINEVRLYWKKPAKGNYISYKEILYYSAGGIGRELTGNIMGIFSLAVGNMFLSFAVGIRPTHIVAMATIMTIIQFVYPFIRAQIIDNTRTKWGRFRPYIAVMGFVMVGLGAVMAFLPYDKMIYTEKLGWIFGLVIVQSFLAPFYTDTIGELRTVMSPNSNERAKLFSISSIGFSLAPTVTNLILPILAGLFVGGYANIGYYRLVVFPISAVGTFLSLFAAIGCKERVVVEKTYKPKVNTLEGVFQIYRNKYWWLNRISGWVSFSRGFLMAVFQWVFIFQYESLELFGVLVTIQGTASLIGMAVAPILIKKFGSVRLRIIQTLLMLLFTLFMWATLSNLALFFICSWFLKGLGDISMILDPVIDSNVKDYSQYQTGRRMDFTFGAAGQIGVPITMLTAFVYPLIMEYFGFTGNANVLYDPDMFEGLLSALAIFSVVGTAVAVIPFFFYDLNESRHAQVVGSLRLRALYSDYAAGSITPQQIKQNVEQIRKAEQLLTETEPDLKVYRKSYLQALKKFDFKGYRQKRKEYVKAQHLKEEIAGAKLLIEEMHKFETPFFRLKVMLAERLASKEIGSLAQEDKSFLTEAEAMPKGTREEKKFRSYALRFGKKVIKMSGKIQKSYPDGLDAEFDMRALNAALAMPADTKEQKKAKKAAIKVEVKKLNRYNAALKHYLRAKELLDERDRFMLYPEIEDMYDEAVIAVKEQEEADQAEAEREKAEKAAEKERLLAEKKNKKGKR